MAETEIGAEYTTNPFRVRAVQLTEDADWTAIAQWCGGTLRNYPGGTELVLPFSVDDAQGEHAGLGDWIIRTG